MKNVGRKYNYFAVGQDFGGQLWKNPSYGFSYWSLNILCVIFYRVCLDHQIEALHHKNVMYGIRTKMFISMITKVLFKNKILSRRTDINMRSYHLLRKIREFESLKMSRLSISCHLYQVKPFASSNLMKMSFLKIKKILTQNALNPKAHFWKMSPVKMSTLFKGSKVLAEIKTE